MHLFISFFVTDFVRKMGARPGLAVEPLIPFIVQKMDFLPNRLSVINNDDFKRGCVTDGHSFKHGCFPIYIQYLTSALGRILFSSVVMVLAYQPGGPGSNPARILYFCHAFIHFFLCYGLCS